MEDIISLLQKRSPEFSRRQQLISKYILENYDSASFMTASRLAAEVGVSESTVVRFSKELGYDGYPQLRKAMQNIVRGRFNADRILFDTSEDAIAGEQLSSSIDSDIEKLREARSLGNSAVFVRAVNALTEAQRVYVSAAFKYSAIAEYFRQGLSLIREGVYSSAPYEDAWALLKMKAGDMMVFLNDGTPGDYHKRLLELAQERFVQIVCIGANTGMLHMHLAAEGAATVVCILDAILEAARNHYNSPGEAQINELMKTLEGHGEDTYA